MVRRPRLLFLCTGNSCRSQMAEGFARALFGDAAEVSSAGTEPADRVHPLAVEVMAERGVDLSSARTKGLDDLPDLKFDLVVTVCNRAREACPLLPGARMLHWDIPDPAAFRGTPGEWRAFFARTADDIRARIEGLGAELGLTDRGDPPAPEVS
jgi:arsenate reductase